MDLITGKTYLLVWNPKEYPWDELEDMTEQVFDGQDVLDTWKTISKKIQPEDRLFLIRLGKEPKGIVASGWATSGVEEGPHYKPELAAQGKKQNFVNLIYDHLLNPAHDEPLPVARLQQGSLESVHWYTESSGIEIKAGVNELERLWHEHLSRVRPETDEFGLSAVEGKDRLMLIRHRSREWMLREAKVESYGREHEGRLPCEVCGFDFLDVYGEIGCNFAHVHHRKPLGECTSPSETKLSDLAIVCANCHAMIHRGGECRPMETLLAERG